MKTIRNILAVLSILAVSSNLAYSADTSTCYHQADLARSIMLMRQVPVPLPKALASANLGDNSKIDRIATMFVEWAYQEPLYRVRENKIQAAEDFSNMIYITCTKTLRGE